MTARPPQHWLWVLAVATGLLGGLFARGPMAEAWYFVFVVASGLVAGSLGLLTIGHLMKEEWVTPIRAEAEAAALTAPLLIAFAVPLGLSLPALFPWADGATPGLPPGRASYLTAPFFLARSAFYLAAWAALAIWITRTRRLRRTSAMGLALLVPTVTFAAGDWVQSREPFWWSTLFGASFAISQLLAALAGAILVSLLRPEHPSPMRMQSLERALMTLALLAFWAWFVQFIIVWLANLPNEAAWYLARSGAWLWVMLVGVLPPLGLAVILLAPPGFGRGTMIAGSALLLLHHGAHMVWLIGPAARQTIGIVDLAVAVALALLWAAWFTVALRARPTFEQERGSPP